ncbi:sirohydrochlorin chelatase [Nocardioides marmotae]|uniref:sirohydrochlorin chelatase n=1 Tax=Nocardioides marmotae TaxID=2663857 RepID=UPI0012B5D78A|nr:hypothetical protein [Nocardioides marmotae]MBC9734814.1 hypothetical protein [Nocardioides marmotae]MTB85915.1 hypothetical protein [Nocardioides marmotae]
MRTLVTVAETSCPVVREVTRRAGIRLGAPAVATVAVDLPAVLERVPGSAVVVPLLLSDAAGLGPPLGPHPLLAAAQASRLIAAGVRPGRPVVMAAAGTDDPAVQERLVRAAALLADTWTGPVVLATTDGLGPRLEDVVGRGTVVSTYALGPGPEAEELRDRVAAAGAAVLAEPIGPHRFVADLVGRRFRALQQSVAA